MVPYRMSALRWPLTAMAAGGFSSGAWPDASGVNGRVGNNLTEIAFPFMSAAGDNGRLVFVAR